jgi:hypothetical protein
VHDARRAAIRNSMQGPVIPLYGYATREAAGSRVGESKVLR